MVTYPVYPLPSWIHHSTQGPQSNGGDGRMPLSPITQFLAAVKATARCLYSMNNPLLLTPRYQPAVVNLVPLAPVGVHPASASLYGQNQAAYGTAGPALSTAYAPRVNRLSLLPSYLPYSHQAAELTRDKYIQENFNFQTFSEQYHEDPAKRSKQELCNSIKKEILSQLGAGNSSNPDDIKDMKNTADMENTGYPKLRGTKRHSEHQLSPQRKRTRSEESDDETDRWRSNPNVPPDCSALTRAEVEQMTERIWQYFESNRQSQEVYCKKMKLHEALYTMIKGVFPYAGLYGVGSSMNGSGSMTSDLDLCLMITHKPIDQKKEATELLRILRNSMHKLSFLKDLILIRAKVPILKFKDRISGVECDLNINNSVGIRNTHLINAYTKSDWRLSPLILFVKHWARVQDINDASKCTISSFSLVLMIIHYLQVGCDPPILPSLQQKYPERFDRNQDIRRLTLNEEIPQFVSGNQLTLGELFLGFLYYYTEVFKFHTDAISVRLARRVSKDFIIQNCAKNSEIGQWKCLCIEEPFDMSNTARSVYDPNVFERIKRVFRLSYKQLKTTGNLDSILMHPL